MERANLPQQRTIAIATQIANAIDAAHESGVLHRDLKPANIKIRPDGVVKVLDFGLAKAFADPSTPPNEPSDSGRGQTTEGAILGTASFMSPEQARGAPVDRRTDIWAFGCVLYEMLAGRPAFDGPTTSDVLAAIFEREPDWSLVPAATHPRLRALLKRCLVKDPKRRLRDIGDAVLDLESLESDSAAGVAAPVVAHRRSRERLAWIVVAALGWALIGLGAFTVFHLREALPDPVQFAITAPEGSTFVTSETPGEFAVSPGRPPSRVRRRVAGCGDVMGAPARDPGRPFAARDRERAPSILVAGQPADRLLRDREAEESPGGRRTADRPVRCG
jgi:hypothetical protein